MYRFISASRVRVKVLWGKYHHSFSAEKSVGDSGFLMNKWLNWGLSSSSNCKNSLLPIKLHLNFKKIFLYIYYFGCIGS